MNAFRGGLVWFARLLIIPICSLPAFTQDASWNELDQMAMDLQQLGKNSEAVTLAAEALKKAEAEFGTDDARAGAAANILASLYKEGGKYSEAEPLYQRSLRIFEKVAGPDHPAIAATLSDLASMYEDEGKYADAEPLFQRALQIHEKAPGSNGAEIALALNNLALLYRDEGKYADAEPLYERALQIVEKVFGPDDPVVAKALDNLAELNDMQGKFAEAEPLFQRALQIDEKTLEADDPDIAAVLINLAAHYTQRGKYIEAEPLYKRAIAIDEKALGAGDRTVAAALNDLAFLYASEGKYGDAELLDKRALAIDEKALGPDHPDVTTPLDNLAGLYRQLGKYGDAEPLYLRSLKIREKALGSEHPLVATSLNNLAVLYASEGKSAQAESLYQRALQINEKVLGPNHQSVATNLNNLALLYAYQRKYAEAEPLFQRALQIDEKILGADSTSVAVSLNNLGLLYAAQGKHAEAESLFQRSLKIRERTLGPDHPGVATNLNNLAELYRKQGKYAAAEPLYQRALSADEKALGSDHPSVADNLYTFARLYDEENKYSEAEILYRRTFDNIFGQFQYNFTYMTEKDRLAFLQTVANFFPGYFSFVHRHRQQDSTLIGSMYNLLLWQKGFIAGSIANMRRQVQTSGDPEALKLLDQLAAKRTQLAALLNLNPPDRDEWRKQIDRLRAEADSIEKSLVARSATFAEQKKLERATWQQIRDTLRPGEAAVEFVRFHYFNKKWTDTSYYVALVVKHDTKDEPQYVVLGESSQIEGDTLIHFQQSAQSRGFETEQAAALPGASAYDLIWKPLDQTLKGATRIYLSPDGILNTVPMGIISDGGGKLLMERYDLRFVSSTKDVLRAETQPAAKTALLIGDPLFSLAENDHRAALEKLALPQHPANSQFAILSPDTLSRDATGAAELPRLPGTGAEVSAIAGLMQNRGWKAGVFTGEMALKLTVVQASSPRVLHLATHGFFLPDQQIKTDRIDPGDREPAGMEDPMLRSGLYFAGAVQTLAGNPSPSDNGVLTAMEAGDLNLTGTELVVLSACNTGQGVVQNGEGVFGLRRAFEEAGAHAVLMSLWSVPDRETQELMQGFYSKWLSGTEMHEALKQSQLEMRDKVKHEHDGRDLPYYWGAFVLVGR
jgi:tetratricopeptide (TPR) repeat protein